MHSVFRYTFLFLAFSLLLQGCEKDMQGALVQIPNEAFLNTLLSLGVDSNQDGLISHAEAEAVHVLILPPSGITDLTGLEAFTHLDSLTITLNPLAHMDLSSNTELRYLNVTYCELVELDISENHLLETLICGRNKLTEIDLSHSRSLNTLVVNNNQLSQLDLSPVASLGTMISCGNQLSYLDISMHPGLTKIGVDNMPMLTRVCVWTLPFPPAGIVVLQGFSPNIEYTTACSR
jgi:Leucine-rich repeat (LRR) protein